MKQGLYQGMAFNLKDLAVFLIMLHVSVFLWPKTRWTDGQLLV